MTLEKMGRNQPAEFEPSNLNLNSVCPAEGYTIGRVAPTSERADRGDLLMDSNDKSLQTAVNQWHNILTKFEGLPPEFQQMVLQSFAPHMTGEEYPGYDRFRTLTA